MMTPRDIAAYHEAGHATVARRLGVKIVRATIKPSSISAGHVAHGNILRRGDLEYSDSPKAKLRAELAMLIGLGGPFAQKRFAPRSPWRTQNHTGSVGGGGDFDFVHDVIYHLHGEGKVAGLYQRYMEAWAEELVTQYWGEVEFVALRLLRHETMTGEEVGAAIWAANGRQR